VLLSRLTGFARDVVIGAFFGTGTALSAYYAALRIPNVIRNLLGEGTLSASFVPVYSSLLEEDPAKARRLARSVLGVVVGLASLLSALGVLLAPLLTRLVVPGWGSEAAALATSLVRILFPMAGVMIVAAWCLGVLNSHRRFFLPFAAPMLWNLAQIGGLFVGEWAGWSSLVHVLAWSTLVGSVLQLGVQLPEARRLVGELRPSLDWSWEPLRRVVRNAVPVISSQGVFQVSSLLDVVLASALPTAAVGGLYYAQRLAYLPLSLFGVSVATAALPEMSRDAAAGEEGGGGARPGGVPGRGRLDGPRARALRQRLREGFFQILWFVLPSAVVFVLFGDLLVSLLFQRRAFGAESTALVSAILAAYSLGLVASSSVKLFAGGFHAQQDTRTPLVLAAISVAAGVGTGAALMFWMKAEGWGATAVAGLVLGGALGHWLNLGLLWGALARRIGRIFGARELLEVARIAVAALAAGGAGHLARGWLEGVLPGAGLGARALLVAGTLVVAGVPYLLTAGRPPGGTPNDG
jgi:putative peptidoglycan lipid II flippase